MTMQIEGGSAPLSALTLEARLAHLERKVAAATEALSILAAGLEGTPNSEPDTASVERAARRAHELLLSANLRTDEH